MPTVPLVPTVRRRRLGSLLRRLRSDAGMSLDAAAAAMSWDSSKLSRIENAKAHIRAQAIGGLLKEYGVTDPEVVTALEGLAKDASKTGWWQTYNGVVSPAYSDYISLESDAESVRIYAPLLIPGLLQTAAYARETIAANAITRTPEEVTALAEVRLARQAVLSRPERPLKLWAVIDEAVLYRRFSDRPHIMRDQLQRLLDASEVPGITIQVMPLDATPHPGGAGAFDLVSFPAPMPTVVQFENLKGTSYVEGTDDVKLYDDAFGQIVAAALPVSDSLARINRLKMSEGSTP
ncbi:helix-turn-helix domain-containing protein [Streptomyces sp. NPDC050485]|uniref:helix-turn-helix domain-containing protein n=1 Tax=Streptomyces sp. NPDC050485 TaxID=3365617 RepID=UPI0037B55FFC